MTDLIIIDTGCANLFSVQAAFARLGCRAHISADPAAIAAADKLLLPGVGTAAAAMRSISARGLAEPIRQARQPLLGICLGMQLLGEYSAEGDAATLAILPARTSPLAADGLPLPHMGWNTVRHQPEHPLFEGIAQDSHFYFVHSYSITVGACTVAESHYGSAFSAAVQQGNFYGVQFHPERSGKSGARLLHNFLHNL